MKRLVLAALAALALSAPSAAAERAADAAEFKGYVDSCAGNTDERGVDGCIADQVLAKVSYLGDILSETANGLTDTNAKLQYAAQDKFEAYGKAACSYQLAALKSADKRAELFCMLRLVNQRIADVIEGEDFLTRD